jgi:hypothetical protein
MGSFSCPPTRGRHATLKRTAWLDCRGEISGDRDWSLVADVVLAMGLLRVVRGQTVNAGFVQQVIDTLIRPTRGTRTAHRSAPLLKPS